MTPLLLPVLLATQMGTQSAPAPALSPRDSAIHALNRLAWGPSPGLVDSIARTGVMRWVDEQLRVERPGDRALARREAGFETLGMSREELVGEFTRVQRERVRMQRENPMRPDEEPGARAQVPGAERLRRTGGELQQATVIRMVLSRNQLAEVMADVWFNHFNVHMAKGLDRVLTTSYVEETIRPHVMGRFEDLLVATATSPAMMFYLDNAQSVAQGAVPPQVARLEQARRRGRLRGNPRLDSLSRVVQERMPTGLNENYARELLELHTLGVDGGYSQADVTEVARILTGWGISRPQDGAGFEYHDWAHDRNAKHTLGLEFPAGKGRDEGRRLLEHLADHPSTRHHVSARLCARLVSDEPPDGCVDAAVKAWRESGGEIRQVVRAIVTSPDFWAPSAVGSKVKTPLEFVVSAVRVLGAEPDSSLRLAQHVARLGQPLYLMPTPNGYAERQDEWVNSGALLARMNFAVGLAAGRLPGVIVDLDRVVPLESDPERLVEAVNQRVLSSGMSDRTREVILREISDIRDPRMARAYAVGLAIGGPEFQRQ